METINHRHLHEKSTSDVPSDIIRNILVRLPVKSLLRFQAVSGTWEATISDPLFFRTHLQQSKSSPSKYIFIYEKKPASNTFKRFKLAQIKNQELQVESLLNNPAKMECFWMCYLDGLLLLLYREYKSSKYAKYALWNPSTATFIKFKCPYSLGNDPRFYGICYDPLIEDYKIVMGNASQYAVLYRKNKLNTVQKKCLINGTSLGIHSEGTCFDGSLYWVHYFDREIVCFNSRDNKFKKMGKPAGIKIGHFSYLVLLGGHLCLYHNSLYQFLIIRKDDDRDSWTVFITINFEPSMDFHYLQPLFMQDEKQIIIKPLGFPDYYISYNLSKKTFAKIKKNSNYTRFIAFPFVESLALNMRHSRRFRRRRAYEELREVFFLILG